MSPSAVLRVERRGEVECLVLDRPASANALDSRLQRALIEALARASADIGVRAVLLSAEGARVFSAGADLKEFSALPAGEARVRQRELLRATLLAFVDFDKPLVVSVLGKAIGAGCMLAFLADEVHAGTAAQFSLPEILLGTPTPAGATIAAARGGRRAALRLALSGEPMAVEEALALGLIDGCHAPAGLLEASYARAQALAKCAGDAYAQNRKWINAGLRAQIVRALDESARLQAAAEAKAVG